MGLREIVLSELILTTRTLLKEFIYAMDEDFTKDENKHKLLSQFDQERSYLSTDIVMNILDKGDVVVAVIISGYVAKTL